MTVIEEVHQDRQDLARVLKKHKGIREIVEDLYPESAHFIFELLQNAEDAGATDARYLLSDSAVTFEHNGRPFNEQDLWAITDIGEGTKKNDADTIGRFGIGFKAVFAYSETPRIWSPSYSFQISDLVLPTPIDPLPNLDGRTCFEFPFNSPKKTRDDAYAEVKAGFNQLALETLLFLSHLQSLRWQAGGSTTVLRRVQHSEHHVEVLREHNGRRESAGHYLKFVQPIQDLETQRVSVAYELGLRRKVHTFDPKKPINKQFTIKPARRGTVCVYFPAEKETSGLRFHLHAPFVPELSRASIKDTPANVPLFQQLALLMAESLHAIRELGLLTRDFLGVLPNPQDTLGDRYECIRDAVIEEMRTQPLTPTHIHSHAPSESLLQAKRPLKDLLSHDDLECLITCEDEPRHWAVGATQKNSDVDHFLDGLGIEEWDIDEFVALLRDKATVSYYREVDEQFVEWLSRKPTEWHQQFYALLHDALNEDDNNLQRLDNARIIRLSDGNYSVGDECYFPSDEVEHDETHPRVDVAIYASGKSKKEQKKARKFLEEVGVREVGELEEVQAILDQRYADDDDSSFPDLDSQLNVHLKDLRQFMKLVESDPDHADLFKEFFVFQCDDGEWGKPSQLYLDEPFQTTGLRHFHDALQDDNEGKRFPLNKRYKELFSKDTLVRFAKAVGIPDRLMAEKQGTHLHSRIDELQKDISAGRTVRRIETMIDDDWMIPGLTEALTVPPMKEIAKLFWQTLSHLEPKQWTAQYRPNQQYELRREPSTLVLELREHEWIPQGENQFVRPCDAVCERLPENFEFDPNWPWVEAIEFGANDERKREVEHERLAMAKKLGFESTGQLDRARKFTGYPPEVQRQCLADAERRTLGASTENRCESSPLESGTRFDGRAGHNGTAHQNDSGEPSASDRRSTTRKRVNNTKGSFISYVAVEPGDISPDLQGLDHAARMSLEARAIEHILSKEPELQRTPTNNRGFDLFEVNSEGETVRWVEVKAMSGCLQDHPVGMSDTQFMEFAWKHRECYWLYVVEYADDDEACRILRIQDPAGKSKTFTFDHGWSDVADVIGAASDGSLNSSGEQGFECEATNNGLGNNGTSKECLSQLTTPTAPPSIPAD